MFYFSSISFNLELHRPVLLLFGKNFSLCPGPVSQAVNPFICQGYLGTFHKQSKYKLCTLLFARVFIRSYYTEEEAKQGHQEIIRKLRNREFQFIPEVYRLVITLDLSS